MNVCYLLLKFECKITHEQGHRICFVVSAISDECDNIRVEISFYRFGFFLLFVSFGDLEKHSENTFFFDLVSILFLTGILFIDLGER
jgi:hypothetical protein